MKLRMGGCVILGALVSFSCIEPYPDRAPSTFDPRTGDPDAQPPTGDAGTAVPPGDTVPPDDPQWQCNPQYTECKKLNALPAGGNGDWKCHEETVDDLDYLVCVGTSAGTPGGEPWSCRILPSSVANDWVCRRPKQAGDTPSGGAYWACSLSSALGGMVCYQIDRPAQTPIPFPVPGETCKPGTQRWCDGLAFCGWGMITCGADGLWPTTIKNGKEMLDCHERADGLRPDTPCACYHFYFNPKCCERPDCIVPEGANGQICAPSAGHTCDYCNPQKPECQQGICAVSNAMETFCSEPCGPERKCPAGMRCLDIRSAGEVTAQCVPDSFSCYNGI